jgi:hypothetical protein
MRDSLNFVLLTPNSLEDTSTFCEIFLVPSTAAALADTSVPSSA